jgi:3'-phosphoadenosine 5'-phosphosulfate sulfotransferase (PAPS reductase)/FAD synthetase
MTEEEFLLQDRIAKIQSVMRQYGEDNFYISFSGGKDSVVLHHLFDLALPGNKIPRVYANTGIEYNEIVKFVKEFAEKDDRFVIIKPTVPIRQMLEKDGYPFKSKYHSVFVNLYQKNQSSVFESVEVYLGQKLPRSGVMKHTQHLCPKKLMYQFTPEFKIKVSPKCCDKLKKEPLHDWSKENEKPYSILGLMLDEKGQRETAKCLAFRGDKLKAFQPLVPLTKEWEEWFIEKYNIKLCKLYYPPYNMTRTGCKGCPFNITLQKELDTLDKFFPNERRQCETIWKPVYEEYRRIGYRNMRPLDWGRQTTIDEFLTESEGEA